MENQEADNHRKTGRAHFFDALAQDIRYGARTLYRYPGFAAAVVFTLALGIGANTAIFSLVDAVLLRLLPLESPEELYAFGTRLTAGTMTTDGVDERDTTLFGHPAYLDLREHNEVFTDLAGLSSFPVDAYVSPEMSSPQAGVEKAEAWLVSGNFFSVLGVPAAIGRTFTPEDDRVPGAHPVVVISHAYWSRKFGRDLSALGQTLRMNGAEYTVLGVTPPEFLGTTVGSSADMWVPLMMQSELMREESRLDQANTMWMRLVGRLKPGVTEAQAGARTSDLFRQLLREEAGSEITPEIEEALSQKTIELAPFGRGFSFLRSRYSQPLLMLAVVVGLVLLIACANVGNLLLARASGRHREVALRLAVGSSRVRMLRQLLTESLMLSLLGGLVGLLMARWAIDFLLVMISRRGTAIPLDVQLDGRVLLFTLLAACLAAILFGLAPALHTARVDLISSLRNQGTVTDPRQQSWLLRRILVVSQVAVSLVLLIGAGLFLRTLQNLQDLDTGFQAEDVLLLQIDPQGGGYKPDTLANLYQTLVERVEAIPEVRSASMSLFSLFSGARWRAGLTVEGYEPQSDEDTSVYGNMVTPGYFETVGIPLLAGRAFEPQDREGAPQVVVVNETFARHFFGDQSPLGRRFSLDDEAGSYDIEIVGLAKDLKYYELREETPRMVYFAASQQLWPLYSMEVRAGADSAVVAPQVRRAIQEVAPNLPINEVLTLTGQVERSLQQEKLLSKLTVFFGLLALLLASVGLYGVMAYGVTQRTNEIGIRMALGARRAHVVWMVLKDGALMVAVGAAIGIATAVASTRFVSSLLYGLSETDPLTLFLATGFLVLIAVFAGYLPARRASRMDPLAALRYE